MTLSRRILNTKSIDKKTKVSFDELIKAIIKDFGIDRISALNAIKQLADYKLLNEKEKLNNNHIQLFEEYVNNFYITENSKLPKKGSIVKLQPNINLVSFMDLKKQDLKVIGYKDTGLISGPSKFLVIKDESGKTHEINPEYII